MGCHRVSMRQPVHLVARVLNLLLSRRALGMLRGLSTLENAWIVKQLASLLVVTPRCLAYSPQLPLLCVQDYTHSMPAGLRLNAKHEQAKQRPTLADIQGMFRASADGAAGSDGASTAVPGQLDKPASLRLQPGVERVRRCAALALRVRHCMRTLQYVLVMDAT